MAKKDRRSLYTEKSIKEALLDALAERDFSKVTVSDVCARTDVHRTTFYLHFESTDEVLRGVIDDMASQLSGALDQFPGCTEEPDGDRMPLCQLIRKETHYRPIFMDPSLREYFAGRLGSRFKEPFVRRVCASMGIAPSQAEYLFWFQLHGCLAVAVHNIELPDEEWSLAKRAIDEVIQRGMLIDSSTKITIS